MVSVHCLYGLFLRRASATVVRVYVDVLWRESTIQGREKCVQRPPCPVLILTGLLSSLECTKDTM